MDDLKSLMRFNYISYASYVILERAIPSVVDGLKPVQRRILHTLWKMHDGKLHKVANVAGQAMAFHPHGDAPIIDALINLANKGFLLRRQGNFGNLYTGDPAAAARYIETALSPLAVETLFNPDLTEMTLSYDSRNEEPVDLPAKVPLLLMQGAQGIAVGMSTHIFPHNFKELIEAEIAYLEGKPFDILPDFPTGGLMDVSEYNKGRGKVKLRAKVEVKDPKTLVIREICYGTSTESLIHSIDEAAKKGKIKIDTITDFTADKVEIEIKLPRGHYAENLLEALYAFTDCEVSLNAQCLVIRDDHPWETDVHAILSDHAIRLKGYLQRELEIEKGRLEDKIFHKTLERLFIENRIYKLLEKVKKSEDLSKVVAKGLTPYHGELARFPSKEDIEKLLTIPIRRISLFDLSRNQEEIAGLQNALHAVEKELKNVKKYTINYLKKLLKTYGAEHPRLTQVTSMEEIDKRAIAKKDIKVGFDLKTGFVGTKVSGESIECTNFDKLLVFFDDGSYRVISIPEKQYVAPKKGHLLYVGVADKASTVNVMYKEPKTHVCYAKRFIVKQFILDRPYRYFEEGMQYQFLSVGAPPKMQLHFFAKLRQRVSKIQFSFEEVRVKGVSAKGIRMASRGVKRFKVES